MKLINFLLGKRQFSPLWADWLMPYYTGDMSFRWLCFTFQAPDALGGESLFMYWRRKRLGDGK